MIVIDSLKNCSGCTACSAACIKDAITMRADSKGFVYPYIDTSKCIECGLCEKVCPQINTKNSLSLDAQYFAFRTKDSTTLNNSSSGGIFFEIASFIIEKKHGVVCGVIYDDNMVVKHSFADNITDLKLMQGSKYVQSDLSNIYRQIKCYLAEGRYVMFSGTPCQVAGLKLFLRKPYSNLLMVDLICHSVPSPLIFKDYVNFVEKKNNKKLESIKMRDKEKGWSHRFYYRYLFRDGTSIGSDTLNCEHWGRFYFSGLITRPSCEECKFTSYERAGDITIADYWDDAKQRPDAYCTQGTSLVIVSTQTGLGVYSTVADEHLSWELTKGEAFQHCLEAPHAANLNSTRFWKYYFKHGFIRTYNRYFDRSFINKVIRKVYKITGHPII